MTSGGGFLTHTVQLCIMIRVIKTKTDRRREKERQTDRQTLASVQPKALPSLRLHIAWSGLPLA